jgi:hypothetical protein
MHDVAGETGRGAEDVQVCVQVGMLNACHHLWGCTLARQTHSLGVLVVVVVVLLVLLILAV